MKLYAYLNAVLASVLATAAVAQDALAQDAPAPAEVAGEPISTLMFFTIGAALAIAIGAFVFFLRSRSNRAAAERALDPNHPANR